MSDIISTMFMRDMESGRIQRMRIDGGSARTTIAAGKRAAKGAKFSDEIVVNIISRIPFPALFKARILSKNWYYRLSLSPALTDSFWPSFNRLVPSLSPRWPIYCPVYMGLGAIIGFDHVSGGWQTLMDLSHLSFSSSSWTFTCEGPLVCLMNWEKRSTSLDVKVSNPITKDVVDLEFRRHWGEPIALKITLLESHAYLVLIVSQDDRGLSSYVYDSRSSIYRRQTFAEICPERVFHESPYPATVFPAIAYLNGKFYSIFGHQCISAPVRLWVYDVMSNSWSTIPNLPPIFKNATAVGCGVLLCDDKVMVAVWITKKDAYGSYLNKGSMEIFELNVLSLELKLLSLGPPDFMYRLRVHNGPMNVSADSNFIYFGQTFPGNVLLTYNILTDKWDCLPSYNSTSVGTKTWTTGTFRPGNNPFFVFSGNEGMDNR